MTKETLIKKAIASIGKLPNEKLVEVNDFIDFILKKHDEEILSKGIEKLISKTQTYDFLKSEEDLYTVSDLKEKYNGKG